MPTGHNSRVGALANGTGPVLVVDDDAEARDSLQLFLEGRGYSVRCAEDGAEALAELRAGVQPAVIILDLRMPVMDGRTFLAESVSERLDGPIPVIVMSADDDRGDLQGRAGVVAVVGKPCDVRQLERIIFAVAKSR
jgi:CheY-like chemotaxis protein